MRMTRLSRRSPGSDSPGHLDEWGTYRRDLVAEALGFALRPSNRRSPMAPKPSLRMAAA